MVDLKKEKLIQHLDKNFYNGYIKIKSLLMDFVRDPASDDFLNSQSFQSTIDIMKDLKSLKDTFTIIVTLIDSF